MVQKLTDTEAYTDECVPVPCNKAHIFLGLVEYKLNSLLGTPGGGEALPYWVILGMCGQNG